MLIAERTADLERRQSLVTLRDRIKATLAPIVSGYSECALVGFPDSANVGDSAIWLGELAWLREVGVRVAYRCHERDYDANILAQSCPNGLILLHGGGNLGDLWPRPQRLREQVIQDFPRRPIVQLPQSIHFGDREALARTRAVFDGHPDLTIVVRDSASLELADRECQCRAVLCPDMAFYLGALAIPRVKDVDVLWLKRTDREAVPGNIAAGGSGTVVTDWLDPWPPAVRRLRETFQPLLMRHPRRLRILRRVLGGHVRLSSASTNEDRMRAARQRQGRRHGSPARSHPLAAARHSARRPRQQLRQGAPVPRDLDEVDAACPLGRIVRRRARGRRGAAGMRLLTRFSRGPAPSIPARVREEGLTYLSAAALDDLQRTVQSIERQRLPGLFIEAGCALGGSALVITAAKRLERPFNVYDVFGMIPPPGEKDGPDVHRRYDEIRSGGSKGIRGATYYGYQPDLLQTVTATFLRYGFDPDRCHVRFIEGLFEHTLRIDGPVALAHVDGDWYESVFCCLARIEPWLVPGGVFVIDDYDAWSGCRRAVDEYFADKKDRFEWVTAARLHLVRK